MEIEDNTLTVSGSRERAENVEDERSFRSERRFGDFIALVAYRRSCGRRAQAHYANGTLEVTSRGLGVPIGIWTGPRHNPQSACRQQRDRGRL